MRHRGKAYLVHQRNLRIAEAEYAISLLIENFTTLARLTAKNKVHTAVSQLQLVQHQYSCAATLLRCNMHDN